MPVLPQVKKIGSSVCPLKRPKRDTCVKGENAEEPKVSCSLRTGRMEPFPLIGEVRSLLTSDDSIPQPPRRGKKNVSVSCAT